MPVIRDISSLNELLSQQIRSSNNIFDSVQALADLAVEMEDKNKEAAEKLLEWAERISDDAAEIKRSAHGVAHAVKAA